MLIIKTHWHATRVLWVGASLKKKFFLELPGHGYVLFYSIVSSVVI